MQSLTEAVEEEIQMKLYYLEMIHYLQQGRHVLDIPEAKQLEQLTLRHKAAVTLEMSLRMLVDQEQETLMDARMMLETKRRVQAQSIDYCKERLRLSHDNRVRPINRQLMANILAS